MHSLRRARNITSMVLACFILSLGVAMMAPAMAGVPMFDDICSVDAGLAADGSEHSGSVAEHLVHCPACVHSAAPPPIETVAAVQVHAPAASPAPPVQPALHEPPPAPWTARGPPSLS
jgi:hypothetical protein